VGFDPREEVGDLGEDTRGSLTGASSPGDDSDDVKLSRLGLGGADERATRVTHAGRVAVGAESDHTRLDHVWPAGFQVGILPDLSLELLESVGHVSWRLDETPAGKPASFSSVIVISGIWHTGWASVGGGEVNILSQLDQSDIMFNWVWPVELGVDDDLGNFNVFLGSVVILLVPFTDTNTEFGRALRLTKAVGSAKDPARGDQSTSADVLSLEEGERGESEGDLPGELAMGGRETVDNAASSAL